MRASAKARRGSCQAMEVLLGIASLWTRTPTSTGLLPHKVDTYSPEECVEQELSEVHLYGVLGGQLFRHWCKTRCW